MVEKFTIASKASSASNLHEYSVSELSGALKSTIEDNFSLIKVRGELGRVTTPASGHIYLDLKDERSVLNGVVWKGMAGRLKIKPEQGMEVIATGRMTTFAGQSRYQIVIDTLEPAGEGALMALYEQRKKLLASEGLFADDKKQSLPFMPSVIGVVTSPTGAVIRDILHRLRERFPAHVLVWPTLVQGKEAEKQIVAAIEGFNALAPQGEIPRPDVLIVARGGGSLEDLWCFNEESVARAASASKIPLISAVGHETDTTLIDYVADRRAPTPSAAAEMATPVRSELVSELLNKERRLVDGQSRLLSERRANLRAAERGLGRPEDVLGANGQRLDRLADQLMASARQRIDRARTAQLQTSSRLTPAILATGFEARKARVTRSGEQLSALVMHAMARRSDRIRSIRLGATMIAERTNDQARHLKSLNQRLSGSAERLLLPRQHQLTALEKLLTSLSHKSVLARGFALVRDETGALIRTVKGVKPQRSGAIEFSDGTRAITFGEANDSPHGDVKPASPAKKKRLSPKKTEQSSLFD